LIVGGITTLLAVASATVLRSLTSSDLLVLIGCTAFVGAFLVPAAVLAPRRVLGPDVARFASKAMKRRRKTVTIPLAIGDDLRSIA
jgi:hypothetical protein